MAPRKTTSRNKRAARGKSSGQSTYAIMTIGAIVALGAAALWATSQNKTPSESVSGLFHSAISTASRVNSPDSKSASSQPNQSAVQSASAAKPHNNIRQTAPMPQNSQTKQTASLTAPLEPKPAARIATAITPPPTAQTLPPIGKPIPSDDSRHANGAFKVPKVIAAKQPLIIREKAWEQAKAVGRVEKGREMRSYAKVGRWHRVVVPSTNIIGWVMEDQLVYKDMQSHTSNEHSPLPRQTALPTRSINTLHSKQENATVKPSQNTNEKKVLVPPLYPQQPVGKQ